MVHGSSNDAKAVYMISVRGVGSFRYDHPTLQVYRIWEIRYGTPIAFIAYHLGIISVIGFFSKKP
ncbi:MAG: hypothetical protein LW865_02050 [Betaproteobacteria bacterium]|jgi:hypothetical protein|nr:hypothetical protein [Rhodocyclaceae bacterium]MCE2722058.1 hypothetical protein [Betaproteobacteria bacterium]